MMAIPLSVLDLFPVGAHTQPSDVIRRSIAHVASATGRIRIGAGGIMLPNHTPLRIVEIFRTLNALHPDRIDPLLDRRDV
jgi:hypothetical protein